MRGLGGKNVLVTGGTSGIGQAIAVRFAEEGARVAINYRRDPASASETDEMLHQAVDACCQRIAEHGVDHILVRADLTREEDIVDMFEETVQELGGIDILINNAGFQIAGDSHQIGVDAFDHVLQVNLRGTYLCAREAIRHFLTQDKPGVIINVSSVHEVIPKPRFVGYSVSKGGLRNLTRTLALEYAGRGIRVNAIGPGATITPINRAWVDDPDKRAQVEQHIPMGRPGTAAEIAGVTAFLASEDAAYITGQTLYVDGGLTLYPDFRTDWSSE
jgi:glucose 1-dehydrogenase